MVIGINQDAYRVERANWKLFTGLASLLPTLNGDGLPTVPFKCAVTISAIAGHSDVAGSVTIGTETLSFVAATRKTTTVLFSALPAISQSGLDCNILIEALGSGGANIQKETAIICKTRFQDSQKAFQQPTGVWAQSQAIADTTDAETGIGNIFSYDGYDYQVAQVQAYTNLSGAEKYRRLFLTGRVIAPTDRAVLAGDDMALTELMRKTVYDEDADGVVDKAEGIPVLDEIPSDLSSFSDGDMFKVGTRTYVVDKPT